MLRTGPWATPTILEATQRGGGEGGRLNGRSDGPGESLVGDKLTPTLSVPVLGGLMPVIRRAGFLKSACPPHHRAQQSTNTGVSGLSKATSQRPSYPGLLCRWGAESRGGAAHSYLEGSGRQGEAVPFAPRLHTCTSSSLVLDFSHKPHPPSRSRSRRQEGEGLAGARAPVCNKVLSVLRSGWNDPALKVGKPIFLKRVHHPVFPLKEPEPEVYEFQVCKQ